MTERQDGRGPWKDDFNTVIKIAATYGHLDVMKWLYERGVDYHQSFDKLIEGTPEYIEKTWLYQHCLAHALKSAAKRGHLEVVQWIYNVRKGLTCSNPVIPFHSKPIDKAIQNGHLAIAQWMCKVSDESCSTEAMDKAANNGHLEMLQWLQSNHLLTCTTDAMDGAARNGHLQIVKWLHETRSEGCSSRALHLAASNGHFEVVERLYDNITRDFDVPKSTWIMAARGGHLSILQWLHNHFPGTVSTGAMDATAKCGHLEVPMWLHEHWNGGWTHKAPFFPPLYCNQPFPRLEIIQWLHTHYPNKFIAGVDAAAGRGCLDIVRWLHENNIEEFTRAAMDSAAEYGHLDVVLYLLEHRSEGFSSDIMSSPRYIEVHCLFSTSDNVHPNPHSNQRRV